MRKMRFKTITLIFIQFFFLVNLVWATSLSNTFHISPQYGSIKEVFEAASAAAKPIIIHIQDAHCNYEAQKNMAQLLDYLVKEKNLKLIMVEGGSGDVSLNFLRAYADKKAREEVADKYLKLGKISGEEYLDIVSE